MLRKIYNLLSSVRLALALLIAILISCLVGVTVLRGERAWPLIFNTYWFNGLLVLLVINVASCFFVRIWKRKLTLITAGMVIFHLSFVAIFFGVIYNNLFYFYGFMRLSEGETLRNNQEDSFDRIRKGRFFDLSSFRGETTLIRMHRGYQVDGKDKRVAYEVLVGEGEFKKQGIIYITNSLEYRGFRYFNNREGYTILVILYDREGREVYGAFIPLQSLKQKDGSYLYTTGTRFDPGSLPFPQGHLHPKVFLQVIYYPSASKERAGEVRFRIWPFSEDIKVLKERPAEEKAAVGERIKIRDYYLEAREVRYWVGMDVRYEPGKPIVLTSLWLALSGIVITFIGRLKRKMAG